MYFHSWRSLSELRGIFRTQSSLWSGKFLTKLLTASFCKKAPSYMCEWVLNTSLGLFFYTVYVLLEFQHDHSEVVVRRCSVKKVFLKIRKILLCQGLKKKSLAQVFSSKCCKSSKNTCFYGNGFMQGWMKCTKSSIIC